jgi:hypothetical protein
MHTILTRTGYCAAALGAALATGGCATPPTTTAEAEPQVVNQCVTGSSICRRSANSGPSGVGAISGDTIRSNGGVLAPSKGVTAPGDKGG